MNLFERPIHELHALRTSGQTSTEAIATSVIGQMERLNGQLNAYITPTAETALAAAKAADAKQAKGETLGVLEGMPIALKDIFTTKGVRTTCASRFLEEFVPPYDATVTERLAAAGVGFLGKLNMDEFAMGSSNENSAFGPVRNPWNTDCVPGGSSGGSAAAVAAGMALAAMGTDTGGSIRQPAAFTGLVGVKPTYGRVSRYGMIAFASSLDQAGPMTRDVTDAALLLQQISGHDKRDATCSTREVPAMHPLPQDAASGLKGKKVGIVKEFTAQAKEMHPEARAAFEANLKTIESLGAELVEVSLPHLEHAISVYYILAPSEASSNLGRYDGVRYGRRTENPADLLELYQKSRDEGFGAEVKRRIMLGTFALSSGYYDAYYVRAMKIRELLREDFAAAFGQVDLIASPTSPVPPFALGEKTADPLQMYLVDAFTLPANLAGLPALSQPAGQTQGGLPLGLQWMAPHWEEPRLLQAAYAFEQATDYHTRRPSL